MLGTSMTMIFCVGIGGMMKEMGVIHVVVGKLSQLIRSTFSLIFISEIIAYVAQMLSGSHYFSDVMLQSTMLEVYKKKDFVRKTSPVSWKTATLSAEL